MRTISAYAKCAFVLAVLALFASVTYAGSISLGVTVNTSSLASSPDSEIIFILTNGTGLGNNTATLTNFQFGGGSAGAVDAIFTSGGVSGDLVSGATLNDAADFTNVFGAFFSAGSTLSFHLDLTTNVTNPPDLFSFLILDPTGSPISTTDPSGFDNLVAINIDSSNPAAQAYSDLVTVAAAGVPEPSAGFLLGSGLALTAGVIRRRNRRNKPAGPR